MENTENIEVVVNEAKVEEVKVESAETGAEPDKDIEVKEEVKVEEVKEPTPVEAEDKDNPLVEEYANKYDAMVKENEELKDKLNEEVDKYSKLEEQVKTLQTSLAKLRKANEFASSSSSIQQNQRVETEVRAEDILAIRGKI